MVKWNEIRTSSVSNLHTQDQDKCCIIWSRQVVADQPANTLIQRYEAETEGSCNIWAKEYENEDNAPVFEAVVEENAGEN